MLKLIATLLCLSFVTSTARAGELPDGVKVSSIDERIKHYTFHSKALDKQMAFTVVFPANYDEKRADWPVLFMLHGLGRHERTLVEDPASRERLLAQPYIIVLPKGENGWYFDSPFDKGRQYATYLDEAIALSEQILPISHDRAKRAIGGWSAGGFGSVWACIHHPESFGTLATVIAVVDFPAEGVRFPITEKTFGKDPAEWPKFNPLNRATELKDLNILLVIGDAASDAPMNMRLSEALTKASIKNEVAHLPGAHTFPTVQAGVGLILEFVKTHFDRDADHAPTTLPTQARGPATAPSR
jgi:enterochelin esterase-like enzyme